MLNQKHFINSNFQNLKAVGKKMKPQKLKKTQTLQLLLNYLVFYDIFRRVKCTYKFSNLVIRGGFRGGGGAGGGGADASSSGIRPPADPKGPTFVTF